MMKLSPMIKGFIETGRDLHHYEDYKKIWKLERDPYLLETSCAGIFAVHVDAMNRVASAVGEGSMAIIGGDVEVNGE